MTKRMIKDKGHFHPYHDISVGKNAPSVVNAVVEIPKDSKIKYEVDKETGMLRMDRFMYSAVLYPGDYGFIPQTLAHDDDPLDVFIFTSAPCHPLTLCEVRVIGAIHMTDSNERDDKILAVHVGDPRYAEWESIRDVPGHYLKELKHFLETYKELQHKKTKLYKIQVVKAAYSIINQSLQRYQRSRN